MRESILIDVNDHTESPIHDAPSFAVAAEAAGLDGVGTHDHQGSGRDAFIRLALMARETSRVTLFPSVTNPITRHPAVIASVANSLTELAPGRVRIMLGSGDLATKAISRRTATVAQMRDAALAIRSLLAGYEATWCDTTLHPLAHLVPEPPPLYVNASSPRMLEVAGESADGVYAMVGTHPEVIERAVDHIADGARLRGLAVDDLAIAFGIPVYMGNTRMMALEGMRSYVFSNITKRQKVFSTVMKEMHPQLTIPDTAGELNPEALETLADGLGIVGTPDDCGDILSEFLKKSSVKHIVCRIFFQGENPRFALDSLASRVIPKVRAMEEKRET